MMTYKINYEAHPRAEDIQVLSDGIWDYAKQKKGHEPNDYFAFYIRDENNKILAGCSGENSYGGFFIDKLWVDEELRGKGYGTQLMLAAEKLGKERGCNFAATSTMEWEALEFYKKLGYRIEFERHGFFKDSINYFLRKELIN